MEKTDRDHSEQGGQQEGIIGTEVGNPDEYHFFCKETDGSGSGLTGNETKDEEKGAADKDQIVAFFLSE